MTRLAPVLLLALCLAGAAEAHWIDVKFRNLTAEPGPGLAYRFSVLAVNTEGTTNANNVSFELQNGSGRWEFCRTFLGLSAFEKRTVECDAELPGPGGYTLVFQSERLDFAAGVPASPSGSASPAATPRQPGFEFLAAAGGLAAALLLRRRS